MVTIRKRWFISFIIVLGIPVVGFIIALFNTRSVVTREIIQSNLTINTFIQAAIDSKFENSSRIVSNIILDKRFRDILQKDNTWQDIVVRQGELLNLFIYHKITNPGMDILIYVPELRYILTVGTANPIDKLYAGLVYLGHSEISESEWENLLEAGGGESRFISSPYLSYNAFGRRAMAFCSYVGQPLFGNRYSASVIVSMQYEDMGALFPDLRGSAVLILDSSGAPVYSFGMQLPDFKINLNQTRQDYQIIKYQGTEYVCTFRNSTAGPYAYAVLTKQTSFWNLYTMVEKIIINVMIAALVLGLLLSLSLLQLNYRPIRTVMRSLGQGGAKGNEFDIIRDQVLSLKNDRSRMENDLQKQDRFLREIIFNTALTKNRQLPANDDLLESIGLDCSGRLIVPVSVFPANIEQTPLAYTTQAPYAEVTIAMMLNDVLGELVNKNYEFYKTTVEQTIVFLFFVNQENLEAFNDKIPDIMESICDVFEKKYSLVLDIVIGNEADSIDKLFTRHQEIRITHAMGVISGRHRVIRPAENSISSGNGSILGEEYARLLYEAIEFRPADEALKITGDYFLKLEENNYPFHIYRYQIFYLVSMLMDRLPPARIETDDRILQDSLDSIAACSNQPQLKQGLLDFIKIFYPDAAGSAAGLKGGQTAGLGIFPRINDFILKNYHDINLSLTMISEHIGLSEKYISKLFRMETGQGLLNYIGVVRIKKAKELLDTTNYNLNEVARMAGYSSVKTFRRVFQKQEGINPSDYRSVPRR
ncbi:MAG: helix-turn-helix transcriptional regulator [Treponema sp.]|nr:helix-turn-helix transcriptional regulator [Treponema sp.]